MDSLVARNGGGRGVRGSQSPLSRRCRLMSGESILISRIEYMPRATSTAYQSTFLIVLAILVAMIFLPSPGTDDFDFWNLWNDNTQLHGVVGGYAANTDFYPPLASVILFGAY